MHPWGPDVVRRGLFPELEVGDGMRIQHTHTLVSAAGESVQDNNGYVSSRVWKLFDAAVSERDSKTPNTPRTKGEPGDICTRRG
jgi:hypothetical protein